MTLLALIVPFHLRYNLILSQIGLKDYSWDSFSKKDTFLTLILI